MSDILAEQCGMTDRTQFGASRYFYPKIDYRMHPAFGDLGIPPRSDDDDIDRMISEIDQELTRLHSTHYPAEAELEAAFTKNLLPRIQSLAKYLSATTSDVRVSPWLKRAFEDVTGELREYLHVGNRRHASKGAASNNDFDRRVTSDLQQDGVHICRLDHVTRQSLLDLCAPFMSDMREEAKSNPKQRIVRNFELYGKVGGLLHKFFQRQGILRGLSDYVGSNVNFAGFSLEYSYAGQVWWTGVYSDLGLSDVKTTYMHYDQGCRDPKAIVALSEVGEDNGPTAFVRGSHKKERSTFLHFMVTALDRRFLRDETADQETGNYRPRFANVRYRRELLLLPAAFQGSSHFGDDILDGSPLSEELLKNEVRMTSDVGNCIVFDGNYGIHRGALVKRGERFVFQVIFDIADSLSPSTYLKRRLRGFALEITKSFRR
jgi:hypothetical protein